MKTDMHILAALLISAVVCPLSAAAQSTPQEIIELVVAGDYDGARSKLSETPHSDIDRLFLEAQIFEAQGNLTDAARTYRAMLSIAPGLIPVRQLLADALARSGDYDGARFHYQQLIRMDARPAARRAYANALRQIRRVEPSGVSATITFTPSSNINRGSVNSTFESGFGVGAIDPNGQEKSGVGVRLGGSGFLKYPLENKGVWTLSAGGDKTFYSDETFNVAQGFVAASYRFDLEETQVTATAFANRVLRDLNSDYTIYGLTASASRALDGPNILSYATTIQYSDYDTTDALDGPTVVGSIGWQRQLDPSLVASVRARITRSFPEGSNSRYWGFTGEAGLSKNFESGWAGFAGLEAGLRRFDDVFTFGAPKRKDEYVALKGSLLNSSLVFQGFSPRLNCLAQANTSNISFYEYNVLECGIQFTQEF